MTPTWSLPSRPAQSQLLLPLCVRKRAPARATPCPARDGPSSKDVSSRLFFPRPREGEYAPLEVVLRSRLEPATCRPMENEWPEPIVSRCRCFSELSLPVTSSVCWKVSPRWLNSLLRLGSQTPRLGEGVLHSSNALSLTTALQTLQSFFPLTAKHPPTTWANNASESTALLVFLTAGVC